MLRYLIPAILSAMTSGCIVTTYGHVQSVEQIRNDDAQWQPRVRQLPKSSRRLAEVVLATDSKRVRHGHVAVRDEQSSWIEDLATPLSSSNNASIPLKAPAARLVKGVPAELARWLSIAEFHWQVGAKGHAVRHRSVERGYAESEDTTLQNQAIRQVLRFQVGERVICASQRKIYGELVDRPIPQARDLVTAYRRSQGLDPETPFGLRSRELVGQIVMQVFELERDQVRIEVHQGVTRTHSADAEAVDTILVCSMPKNTNTQALGHFSTVEHPEYQAVLFQPAQKVAWAAP